MQSFAERETLRERLHAAEREVDSLTAKAAALSSALSLSGGAAEIVQAGGQGVRGLVGDAVQVRAGYEAAIAAVLGPLAEGVLVDTAEDAFALAAESTDLRRGVVDFVVADAKRTHPDLPAVDRVTPAVETVTAPDGILGVLSHVLIAEDWDAARAARTALDVAGDTATTIVTLGGDVITAQTLRTGSGGERSRLELAAERDAAAERLAEIQVVVDSLRLAREEANETVETTRRQAKDALRALREHDAALATHAEQVNRVTVRHESAVAECERLEAGLAQAQAAVADAESKAQNAKAALDEAIAAPRPVLDASARDGLLEALELAREGEVRARLEIETLRERVRAAQARVTGLERQH